MKTTHEIIKSCIEYKNITFTEFWCKNKNQRWYSEEELRLRLLDMYRLMCDEYGKANIWSMKTDELLDTVDIFIENKLFKRVDINENK